MLPINIPAIRLDRGSQLSHDQINQFKSNAFAETIKEAGGLPRSLCERFVEMWQKIINCFSFESPNETDVGEKLFFEMFKAEYEYNLTDDESVKSLKREEFITAFKGLKNLVCAEDRDNFVLRFDEENK